MILICFILSSASWHIYDVTDIHLLRLTILMFDLFKCLNATCYSQSILLVAVADWNIKMLSTPPNNFCMAKCMATKISFLFLVLQVGCLIFTVQSKLEYFWRKLNDEIRSICTNAQSLYPVRLIFEIEIVISFDWKILLL